MDNSITERAFFFNTSTGKLVDVRGNKKIAEYASKPETWERMSSEDALMAIEHDHIAAEVIDGN